MEQIFVLFYNKESSAKLHTTWKTIKKINFVKFLFYFITKKALQNYTLHEKQLKKLILLSKKSILQEKLIFIKRREEG